MKKVSDWSQYHGNIYNDGLATGSPINSKNVQNLKETLLPMEGSILSVPAIVGDYVYVGTANSLGRPGANGGELYKINLKTKETEATFCWTIAQDERDTHGFTGMGNTPAIVNGKVYFLGFNAKLYCLNQSDLSLVWVTDLRNADPDHDQPITNDLGTSEGYPVAAGWSSPCVVNDRVYCGVGEGENPYLYSFVFCLEAQTGDVDWVFCTCKFEKNRANRPNELPEQVVKQPLPKGSKYSLFCDKPVTRGSSVWSSPAYDDQSGLLYFCTGNPQPDGSLPSAGWSNGLVALDAKTGKFHNFFQALKETLYRPSDTDVDVGGSPLIFDLKENGTTTRVVGFGCKSGGYFIVDAQSFKCLKWRQLLPYYNYDPSFPLPPDAPAGKNLQIATVDRHTPANDHSLFQHPTNEESNVNPGENFSGVFGVGAVHPDSGTIFVSIGGPNYHNVSAGLDTPTTPFMRALNLNDPHLEDAWPMEVTHPSQDDPKLTLKKYANVGPTMYSTPNESGLSSPAVVNDVVFCSTSKVGVYAFRVSDGKNLWESVLGSETGGYYGGYGYCLGPAVSGNYVVAGGLIKYVDRNKEGYGGGVLAIYEYNPKT